MRVDSPRILGFGDPTCRRRSDWGYREVAMISSFGGRKFRPLGRRYDVCTESAKSKAHDRVVVEVVFMVWTRARWVWTGGNSGLGLSERGGEKTKAGKEEGLELAWGLARSRTGGRGHFWADALDPCRHLPWLEHVWWGRCLDHGHDAVHQARVEVDGRSIWRMMQGNGMKSE